MTEPTIERQIESAERELALREKCYPQWVRAKRMTQAKADEEIACMVAIIKTLKKVCGQLEQPGLI